MRKLYMIFFIVLLLFISFFVGEYIYKIIKVDDVLISRLKERSEEIQEEFDSMYLPTSNRDEIKLSPNARLVFKTKYSTCGHIINDYREVLQNEVNMSQSELKEKYPEWIVSEFNEKEAILEKIVDGTCKQHYIIREKNGNLAIYIMDDEENEVLYETTSISTKYLADIDLERLKNGIRVNGFKELNSILEDFE